MIVNKTMAPDKYLTAETEAVDMPKPNCVLSHIQRDIKENLSHLNPLWCTVWAPSASNIGVECTHLISIILCASRLGLCPLLSGLVVWCPNEPWAAHTAASDVPQRRGAGAVHFIKDTSSPFFAVHHLFFVFQPLFLNWSDSDPVELVGTERNRTRTWCGSDNGVTRGAYHRDDLLWVTHQTGILWKRFRKEFVQSPSTLFPPADTHLIIHNDTRQRSHCWLLL